MLTFLLYYILKISSFLVPLFLTGENHYSLTAVKNIRVTDSFMMLDQSVRKCQTKEPLHECRTKKYLELVNKTCGCLPFSVKNFTLNKVEMRRKFS